MPKRKHSTRNPADTEAVQWTAKSAGCSLQDALLIFNSAVANKAIIWTGQSYEGSWEALLAASSGIWGKHIKRVDSPQEKEMLPDGFYRYVVEKAKKVISGSYPHIEITIRIKHEGQFFFGTFEIVGDGDEQNFMESVGRKSDEEIEIDVLLLSAGWEGWAESYGASHGLVNFMPCPPQSVTTILPAV